MTDHFQDTPTQSLAIIFVQMKVKDQIQKLYQVNTFLDRPDWCCNMKFKVLKLKTKIEITCDLVFGIGLYCHENEPLY